MQNKKKQLIPEYYYHVYNRANGNELLFLNDENYRFFLQKYFEYISPIANTFCYCLMPNHFHFLIQIKAEDELELFFNQQSAASLNGDIDDNLRVFPKFKTLEKLISNSSF